MIGEVVNYFQNIVRYEISSELCTVAFFFRFTHPGKVDKLGNMVNKERVVKECYEIFPRLRLAVCWLVCVRKYTH